MFTFIRKHQQRLLIIVTVIVIIAFAWLYNGTELDKLGTTNVATIYDKELTQTDVERRVRMFDLAQGLGLYELILGLGGQTMDRNQLLEGFVFNGLVLEHEAEKLQVRPTDSQVAAVIRTLPVFQTERKFDMQRYSQFVEENLGPNGFTEQQLESIVRSQLTLTQMRDLVTSSTTVSETEATADWERFSRELDLVLARLDLETFTSQVTPDDAAISEFYENRKETLMTEEERSIAYVELKLDDEAMKLEGPERIARLQLLANKAGDFTQDMLVEDADFEALAAEYGLTIKKTGLFPASSPPQELGTIRDFVRTAYSLTPDQPDSDAIQLDGGFAILHLDEVVESRQMELDEARAEIVETIKMEKGRESLETKGREAAVKLRAARDTFHETADGLELEVEEITEFSLSNPPEDLKDSTLVMQQVLAMRPGDISGFTGTQDGGMIIYLKDWKLPESPETDVAQVKEAILRQKQQIAFLQWMQNRSEAAGIKVAGQDAEE